MLLTIAAFEFRSRLRLLSTWVYFLVFFALAVLWIAAAGGLFAGANISFGSGKVAVNSPYALAITTSVLGIFGSTVMAAIMGRAVQQDVEYRTQSFFFSAPIGKFDYLGGRFLGALAVVMLVFASIPLGAFGATLLPGLDAERLEANRWAAYLAPLATVMLPNGLLIGGVFFTLAAATRRMLPVYVGSVLVLLGWMLSRQLLVNLDNKTLAALLDPFGNRALSVLTQYWTIAERNSRLIPLTGVLLWNRLLWLGVALLVTAACVWRFSFSAAAAQGPAARRGRAGRAPAAGVASTVVSSTAISSTTAPHAAEPTPGRSTGEATPAVPRRGTAPLQLDTTRPIRLLPHLVLLNLRETVKNIYFGVLVLAGVLFMVFASTQAGSVLGTPTWPVTFEMTDLVSGGFGVFMLVIIAFYGGELVWRERENRLDPIVDATPLPTWLPMVAKLLALMAVPVLLQAVLMLCGIGIQAAKGYFRFEPWLYGQQLFGIDLIGYWLLAALAISVHSVVNQKYVGHFVMIVYYLLVAFSGPLGLEHNLYKFGSVPTMPYSDMNGWGHFMPRARAFQAYWGAASVLLLLAGYLMWTRGTVGGWRARWRVARRRLTRPVASIGALAGILFVGLGSFIFYNTNLLNVYLSTHDQQQRQADYERRYKPLAGEPQPKISEVTVDVALYPSAQRIRVQGHYQLVNRNTVPVTTLTLWFAAGEKVEIHRLDLGVPATVSDDDRRLGVRRLRLSQPLAPGAETTLAFDLELARHGFVNEGGDTQVVGNGTFINNFELLPLLGYQTDAELARDQDRRKFGLAPKERMRDRDDPVGLQRSTFGASADLIAFEATVSTDADQIAIAPGDLQREWQSGGRRYFHYKTGVPISNFFAFQSARYALRQDVWNGPNGAVPIEIYYQPGHEFNLAAMAESSKAALAYNSQNFGAYQYRQFRIVEFPRYRVFAQSFPNTVPYSEAIGFIARVRPDDPKDIDYPYYVTAHEVAHQWWGHQIVSGDTQGGTMLIETFAQYSALMVMKQHFGEARMRRFLAYELDRYLTGRGFEQKKELPLARVEDQPYIHYGKGSLVMYALADYIGEANLNRALRDFRDEHAFKGPPYPNSSAFLAKLRSVTPPELHYLIDDLFERIVVYDNHAVSAVARPLAGGRYQVTVVVSAKKRVADELGREQDAPLHDFIDIGAVDADGNAIALQRERIDREGGSYTFVLDKRPARAGIDPLNKLIDRKPDDNTVAVTFSDG